MTSINKQKFLAELGKLLTFMYEEDRQRAMSLYSRMFEEAGDEHALIQALISPTRQAVVVARAYNSNLGRLSLSASTKAAPEDRDENGVPDYVQAIEAVREQAWADLNLPAEAEETEEAPAEAEEAEEAPAEAEEAEEAPAEAEEAEETPAEAEPENKSKPEGIEFFTLPEEGKETPESDTLLDENAFNVNSDALRKPRRKAKPFALFLYILLAIPLTICAIAVLLVPALLFLALSVAVIICGVVLVSTAFKGFAVFADIMVVLGLSMVLFALGLLFLWTAIWFVGGAIVGVVHGVAVLCEKWCYKEVLEA